jgi:V/A-type H+-transporting ATPase subunit A
VARFLKEAWLQQNALDEVDKDCPPEKTYMILGAIKTFHDEAFDALDAGVPVDEITGIDSLPQLNRMGTTPDDEAAAFIEELEADITEQLSSLY